MKMWSSRFKKELDSLANDFNSSIGIDYKMYKEDIMGSMAHANMLCATGIITDDDNSKIQNGLKNILFEIDSGELEINPMAEDIHMFIEEELTERIGDAGKKLHTARSRNDQVSVDIRMYLKAKIESIVIDLKTLIETLIEVAKANLNTVMPGYTHLQVAQPVTFAHHIMAYVQMLTRDISRLIDCYNRMNENPLGSGALATTTYPIDRFKTTELLNFKIPTRNSMDSVSDRDFIVELNFDISMVMLHLSRFSEEIILWASQEFKFIELDDSYSTGSSIMPQKKNPDMAELVRGKSSRVFGNLMATLNLIKALPLSYNKDLQEDKENIFDSIETVEMSILIFNGMMKTLKVNKENMRDKAKRGFINATDLADYLVKKGLPFRDAYKITGNLVSYCVDKNISLEELSMEELTNFSDLFEADVYKYIDLDYILSQRNVYGGPSPDAVKKQILDTKAYVDTLQIK
ncbi:argininosuccinate lyase [Anaerosphaera multitolerans]|uniref:Argininosuccinate lyase n=1 Tax=Anaerosphaera multitolerans TaxID=2487351 RepID=A0A437S7B8_9FIRM|nr:argininosuccinate lyase [Anaerosphaera multitolerans]RVU54828.1 argininosuccinate lyase [Anaerosphaera multitolerans]